MFYCNKVFLNWIKTFHFFSRFLVNSKRKKKEKKNGKCIGKKVVTHSPFSRRNFSTNQNQKFLFLYWTRAVAKYLQKVIWTIIMHTDAYLHETGILVLNVNMSVFIVLSSSRFEPLYSLLEDERFISNIYWQYPTVWLKAKTSITII